LPQTTILVPVRDSEVPKHMADSEAEPNFARRFSSKELLQCRIQKQLVDVARSEALSIICAGTRGRSEGEQITVPLAARTEIEDVVATVLDAEIGELRRYAQTAASDCVVSDLEHGTSRISQSTDSAEAVDVLKRDLLGTLYEEHDKLEQRIHQWTEEVLQLPCYNSCGSDKNQADPSENNACTVTQRGIKTSSKPHQPAGDSMDERSTSSVVEKLRSSRVPSEIEMGSLGPVTDDNDKFDFEVRGSMKLRRESELEKYIQNTTGQIMPLQAMVKQMQAFEEPAREGCLVTIVHSHLFEKACLFVIIMNIFYIVYETNYCMANHTEEKNVWLQVFELMFCTYYLIEITMKLVVHRFYFFCNEDLRWNLFDFFLVVFGTAEVIIRYTLDDVFVLNPTFLRLFRVLRISKIFRIIRLLRFFNELRLLLKCVMGSFMSLFWSCVLLLVFTVVFAIIFVQQLAQYIVERQGTGEVTAAEEAAIERSFGSVQVATLSLFKGMAGGNDWDPYY